MSDDFHILEINPDEPFPGTLTAAPAKTETGYQHMRAYNLKTGEPRGWLGVNYNSYVYIWENKLDHHGATFKWVNSGDNTYLARRTSPKDRFLGSYPVPFRGSWPCWALPGGGFVYPVIWLPNHTIQLVISGSSYLLRSPPHIGYKNGEERYCTWSDNKNDDSVLRFEFEE